MQKLIKNGIVVNAEGSSRADILIDGEKIGRVEPGIEFPGAEIIDAEGMLILPGGVDPHVHINLPMMGAVSSDDYYTIGKAAAFGGTTSLIDFTAHDEGSLAENVARKWDEADGRASVDYGLHMNITRFHPEVLNEIAGLPEMGITSVKVFTAYNRRLRLGDGEIFQTMRAAARHGLLTLVHAENGDVIDVLVAEALQQGRTTPIWHARTRPAWGEVEASLRAVALAAQAEAPLYLVHMNVAGEVDQLAYGRAHGVQAMGETCPQYLFFTEKDLDRPDGTKWLCSPRCAARRIRRLYGGGLKPASSRCSRPTTARFSMTAPNLSRMKTKWWPYQGKSSAKAFSLRYPTASPASATGCQYFGRTPFIPAGSAQTNSRP